MQSNKLVAWVEPRSRHEFVAAFVSAATASHRAPAVTQCSSLAEARRSRYSAKPLPWATCQWEWVSEPLSLLLMAPAWPRSWRGQRRAMGRLFRRRARDGRLSSVRMEAARRSCA